MFQIFEVSFFPYNVRNNDHASSSVKRNIYTINAIETLVYLVAASFLRTVAKELFLILWLKTVRQCS